MARILVIEDERALAMAMARGLRDEQYVVDLAFDGESGLMEALVGNHDLVVLDLMLPEIPGLGVCRRLRAENRAVPILVVTARDATSDVVALLDAGADDYLVKPFPFDELLARIRALLRRAVGVAGPRHRVGPVEMHAADHRVWSHGVEVALTPKEYALLEALMSRPGAVVARERLLDTAWERDEEPDSNAIEVHVAALRRKLERGGVRLIHTVRGVGYALRPEAP